MSFTTTALTGSRVLVRGTDINSVEGEQVLDTTQWEEINAHKSYHQATAEYEAVVDDFFKPLLEAAEKAENAVNVKVPDPLTYVVLHEGSDGVAPVSEQRVSLSKDSQILRLLDQGNTSRLIWVAGWLEIADTAVEANVTVPSAEQVTAVGTDALAQSTVGNSDASL